MTVATQVNRTTLIATASQTVFTYTFYTPPNVDSDEIFVRVNDAPVTSGFTVDTAAKTVTFSSGRTEDDEVLIYRDLDKVRTTNFPLAGSIDSSELNKQLDRMVAYIQDVDFKMQRFSIQFTLPAAYVDEFTLLAEAYNAFNIDIVVSQTSTGTVDYTIKKNDAAVTDLTSITASSTKSRTKPSTTVSVDPSDKLTISLTDNNAAEDFAITLQCSKVAA